jgi:hypothetical protein
MLFGDITHLQQADRILCGSVDTLMLVCVTTGFF